MNTTTTGQPAGFEIGGPVAIVTENPHGIAIGATGVVLRFAAGAAGAAAIHVTMDENGATLDFAPEALEAIDTAEA